MSLNESDIVRRIQAGELEEFSRLYDAYVRRIHDFVYYRTMHRETAEDVVSLVFLKALERIASFDPDRGTFSAWLHGIARNAVIDHYRAKRDTVDVDDVWDLSSDEDVASDVERRETVERLRPYLAALPKDQRELLLLRLWDGLSYAEIAALNGKSEAANKMAFSRTVARLRKEMPASFLAMFILFRHLL